MHIIWVLHCKMSATSKAGIVVRWWRPERRIRGTHGYSNEKIFFQSFFMLITVQLFFFASS
jgi:hypothetical protein